MKNVSFEFDKNLVIIKFDEHQYVAKGERAEEIYKFLICIWRLIEERCSETEKDTFAQLVKGQTSN
jgi:hypothetical protein